MLKEPFKPVPRIGEKGGRMKNTTMSDEELDTFCKKVGLSNEDWDEGGGFVHEAVVRVVQQAREEEIREMEPLIDKLFEALAHADFSNGIESYGIDEGRGGANEHIQQLMGEGQSLKSEHLKS